MTEPFCSKRLVWHGLARVERNTRVAEQTFRMALTVREDLPDIRAGQFVMLRLPNRSDPLLGRPLAIYRVEGRLLEVVYIVVGKMTGRLAEVTAGEELQVWAPLGRGFPDSDAEHTIMVAGGIGQTPFLMLAETQRPSVRHTLLYGARSADRIACVDDFRQRNVDVRLATEDGSEGYRGFVTDLIQEVYRPDESTKILCCGPHPMLRAAFLVARQLNLPCEVSLETPMSCGLGICFGCVVSWRNDDGSFDYKRTCIDGPVFDAYRLHWEEPDSSPHSA